MMFDHTRPPTDTTNDRYGLNGRGRPTHISLHSGGRAGRHGHARPPIGAGHSPPRPCTALRRGRRQRAAQIVPTPPKSRSPTGPAPEGRRRPRRRYRRSDKEPARRALRGGPARAAPARRRWSHAPRRWRASAAVAQSIARGGHTCVRGPGEGCVSARWEPPRAAPAARWATRGGAEHVGRALRAGGGGGSGASAPQQLQRHGRRGDVTPAGWVREGGRDGGREGGAGGRGGRSGGRLAAGGAWGAGGGSRGRQRASTGS